MWQGQPRIAGSGGSEIEAKDRGRTLKGGRPDTSTVTGCPREPAPTLRKPASRFVVAAVSCALLVGVSVQLIDRPVANWVHGHLGDARFAWFIGSHDGHSLAIGPFSLMAGPAEALRPLALAVLSIIALAAAAGWRPGPRGRVSLALGLSVFVAMEINNAAKLAFGRTWPESWLGSNPSWIHDGVFGFFPFHGGAGWTAFPSGHAAVIAAPATFLWIVRPGLRPLWTAMVVIVVTGLIGANYHFVSDIVGGVYLGVAAGLGTAALMPGRKAQAGENVL